MTLTVAKRLLILLLAPLILLGGLYLWVVLRSPKADSGKLVRTANRKVVWSGSQFEVQLHINADQELPVRNDTPHRPQVIALVLDHSGSMGQGSESPLEAVKSAASIFARITASNEQPVGAVAFDDSVYTVMPLGPDGNACANAIQRIPPGGGTDIGQGLLAGRSMVLSGLQRGGYPGASGLIVLLSDGQSDRAGALQAAQQAKTDPNYPIRIITIGLGAQIDEQVMREMASSEADFHFTLDPAGLGDIYSTIAADFGTVIGYNGQLSEQFNYNGFKLEKTPAGFSLQSDPARGQLNIRFPILFQQRTVIPYTLQAQKVGLFGLALKSAELTYVPDSNAPERTRQIVSPLTPPLLVISPLLLLLLFLPLLGYIAYLIWRWLHRLPEVAPIVEPKPPDVIKPPPPLSFRPIESLRQREPQPTLFLGVGEAGGAVLTHVARLLANERYLAQTADLPLRLFYVNTREGTPAGAGRVPIQRIQLPDSLGGPVRVLHEEREIPLHLNWIPRQELIQTTGSQTDLSDGSHGRRWLARLALFEGCRSGDTPFLQSWQQPVTWLKAHPKARIIILGSLQGGTGSALISDLSYLLRQALPLHTRAEWPVYSLGLVDIPSAHAYTGSNQKAFLAELDRLTVATRLTQPAVFNPTPPPGFEYLKGFVEEPIFDHFFALQSGAGLNSEDLDREFFAQVAAICHTFTENSLAEQVETRLGDSRTLEEQYRNQYLEGTINSAWQYLLRFPATEVARLLACRFVREILGTERLVGVSLSPDGRKLEPALPHKNPLEEATTYWPLMNYPETFAPLYRAFCQAAITGEPRTVAPALQQAAQGSPSSAADFREELRGFALNWFNFLLNGPPNDTDDARAAWCRHKIVLLHAVLSQLTEVGHAALAHEERRGSNSILPLLEETQRFHESVLEQTRSWLHTLIDSEFVSPEAPDAFKGVFSRAAAISDEVEKNLRDENLSSWQKVLGDDDLQARLRLDSLYREYFGPFLEKEHGFLLRWVWKFNLDASGRVPNLQLRLITDQTRNYPQPGSATAQALLDDLLCVADSRTRDLDRITILDALRSETGELRLQPLAIQFAKLFSDYRGLRINRQFPGGDKIQRQLLVMFPDLQAPELRSFQDELRRQLAFNVTLVPHGDPHAIRGLVVDSVIPIKAAQVEPAKLENLPFICEPEQEGERLRREITDTLGVAPCPQFHPLTRLLAVAPRRREEWAGILAENCIKPSRIDGIKASLAITDGASEEPLLFEYQRQSWLWAILNLAYRVHGLRTAETVRLRWLARDRKLKVEMLGQAVERLQAQVESLPDDDAEREILSQVVLLLRLEHQVQLRRYEEEQS
jgi:hypothetical protein